MSTELEDWHSQNTEKVKAFMEDIPRPEEKPLLTHEKLYMSSDVTFGDPDNFLFFVSEALKRLAILSASSECRLYFCLHWFQSSWPETEDSKLKGLWIAKIQSASPVDGLNMFQEQDKPGYHAYQPEEIQLP